MMIFDTLLTGLRHVLASFCLLPPSYTATVRDGAIEIGSVRAVGLISEIEGEIGRSVGPISRRFL